MTQAIELLTIPEVARELRVSQRQLERLLASRQLRRVKMGRLVRVRRTDLNAFIEKRLGR